MLGGQQSHQTDSGTWPRIDTSGTTTLCTSLVAADKRKSLRWRPEEQGESRNARSDGEREEELPVKEKKDRGKEQEQASHITASA